MTPTISPMSLKRVPWTPKEDELLASLGNSLSTKDARKWKNMASQLEEIGGFIRTGRQCRQRYLHIVGPNIERDLLSMEEEKQLLGLYLLRGPNWSMISGCMGRQGISPNTLKNRFYSLARYFILKVLRLDPISDSEASRVQLLIEIFHRKLDSMASHENERDYLATIIRKKGLREDHLISFSKHFGLDSLFEQNESLCSRSMKRAKVVECDTESLSTSLLCSSHQEESSLDSAPSFIKDLEQSDAKELSLEQPVMDVKLEIFHAEWNLDDEFPIQFLEPFTSPLFSDIQFCPLTKDQRLWENYSQMDWLSDLEEEYDEVNQQGGNGANKLID